MKTGAVFAMPVDMTVSQAISNMVIHRITCALAMNAENEVEGIFTARDLMRFLHYGQQGRFKSTAAPGQVQQVQQPETTQAQGQGQGQAAASSSPTSASFSSSSPQSIEKMTEALAKPISHLITRREKMVYCSPTDTARRCREMMFQLKIRNIPVLDQGVVVGIINIKDLADSNFTFEDSGGRLSVCISYVFILLSCVTLFFHREERFY
jgi:CBS domain-containing protein